MRTLLVSVSLLAACGRYDDGGAIDAGNPADGDGGAIDAAGNPVDARPDTPDGSPGTPIFFDDFEYPVARDDANAQQLFTAHGWWDIKSLQAGDVNAAGYLYTADAIPGFGGSFPGGGARVLAMEALAGDFGHQTDFWLKYGDEAAPTETVPGNVWFQFWIYVNHHEDGVVSQLSQIGTRDKFIYPCAGPYPCNATTGGNKWLYEVGASTGGPESANPYGLPSPGDLYSYSRDNTVGTVNYALAAPGDESKLFQQDAVHHVLPNVWTLVKLHWDTSTAEGSWEAWLTPRGQPTVKVAEWVSGVTPNFTWSIPAEHIGGHRQFAMPTTIPGPNNSEFYNFWIYLDDFAMAAAEVDLPTYP